MATVETLEVELKALTSRFDAQLARSDAKLGGIAKTARLASAAVLAVGGSRAVRQIVELTKRGGDFANVMNATAKATGDAEVAVAQLRRATRGLVSDYDLAVGLNRALTLGAAETTQQYGQLAQTGIALGRALGVDAASAVESLSLGIGRQSKLILDNLGLIVSVEEANQKYAEAVGKSADALTDAERREAFRNAALDAAKDKVNELGDASENNADKIQQIAVAFRNATDAAGEWLAQSPEVAAALNGIVSVLKVGGLSAAAAAQGVDIETLLRTRSIRGGSFAPESAQTGVQQFAEEMARMGDSADRLRGAAAMMEEQFVEGRTMSDAFEDFLHDAFRLWATPIGLQDQAPVTPGNIARGKISEVEQRAANRAAIQAALRDRIQAEQAEIFRRSQLGQPTLDDELAAAKARLDALTAGLEVAAPALFELGAAADVAAVDPGAPGRMISTGTGGGFTGSILGYGPNGVPIFGRGGVQGGGGGSSFLDSAFGNIDPARMAESALGNLLSGGMSSLLNAATGLLGSALGSILRGGGPSDREMNAEAVREASQDMAQAARDNVQALVENTRALLGKGATGIASDELLKMIRRVSESLEFGTFRDGQGGEFARFFDASTREQGLLDEVRNIAEQFGVSLTEIGLRVAGQDATGIPLSEIEALLASIRASLDVFDGFAGRMDLLNRQLDAQDIDGALERFEAQRDLLADILGEVGSPLEDFVDSLSAENIGQALQEMLDMVSESPEQLARMLADSGLSISEFIDFLTNAETSLDDLADAAADVSRALRNVPSGFKVALAEFRATQTGGGGGGGGNDVTTGVLDNPNVRDDPFYGNVTVNITATSANAEEVYELFEREMVRQTRRGGTPRTRLLN